MSGGFDFTVIIEGKTMKSVAQFVANKLSTAGFGTQHIHTFCTEKI